MAKLISLKDMEIMFDDGEPFEYYARVIREEAIKWLKYGSKHKVEPGRTQWLAFFNLQEEDLK